MEYVPKNRQMPKFPSTTAKFRQNEKRADALSVCKKCDGQDGELNKKIIRMCDTHIIIANALIHVQ